ncbi:MAG TPA: hypothetical protein VND98_01645 [Solirubrobacterales bacterium]|nr:hypothetical protein [Solirubrobacterales bacterium]
MSFLSGISLELGIGIAVGMLAGTTGTHGSARGRMTLLAAVIGLVVGVGLAGAANLSGPIGALFCLAGAAFACVVVSDLVASARKRKGVGTGAIGFLIALAALVLVGVSVLLPLAALPVTAALAWLAVARSRRARRKHAGLRVLR